MIHHANHDTLHASRIDTWHRHGEERTNMKQWSIDECLIYNCGHDVACVWSFPERDQLGQKRAHRLVISCWSPGDRLTIARSIDSLEIQRLVTSASIALPYKSHTGREYTRYRLVLVWDLWNTGSWDKQLRTKVSARLIRDNFLYMLILRCQKDQCEEGKWDCEREEHDHA